MKNINYLIEKTEQKWLNQLFQNCKDLFSETKIPSHDHTHHFRVWSYCKEIILALHQDVTVNYDLIERCIIAAFFHDTGLTQTLKENHGKESKEICKNYFISNHLDLPVNFNEILLAIEKHDDKNYQLNKNNAGSLFTILCNADDLDAFGNIGIVRYTEIYLMRGVNLRELPSLVIENLDKRFTNFQYSYQNYTNLINKHKSRYRITRKFFEEMQEEFI